MESQGKYSILIVEDEDVSLNLLCSILAPEYTLYITKNGASALEMAGKNSPDLILLDIILPEINGFDVLKALKASENLRDIPVIIITGLNGTEDEEKGLDLGTADFIHKPISRKIVLSRVRNQIQIIDQIRVVKQYAQEMQMTNEAKSVFLAKMSHEIRTPLNAVLGISEIQLQNKNIPPDIAEAFTMILNSGSLLLGIINDILDLSKIESGKMELILSPYDIAGMINDTAFLHTVKNENKPIKFIISIDENVPIELSGDELRIKQILNNLLSNAFKYTDSGEVELSLNAEYAQDSVILIFRIRDSGQGMTSEQISKLYDAYARFNMERNKATEGTGLGMAITQNLIQLMNGKIKVDSEPGKGSVFTVILPQGNTGAPALGKEAVKNLGHLRQNFKAKAKKARILYEQIPSGKILIVDDMEMNLYVAKGLMMLYGLQIDTALSGKEAIEKIKANNYDIVFMDHMMPSMDGIEATRLIREWEKEARTADTREIAIIALTANAVSGMSEMFAANGFSDFLSKPIIVQELDDILKKYIAQEKIIPMGYSNAETMPGSDGSRENQESPDSLIDSFWEAVCKISEINTEIGLSYTSDRKDTYRNALNIFNKNALLEFGKMSAFLDDKDLKSFCISVHAMKSMLATIGAKGLSDEAYTIEASASKQDIDSCTQMFSVFREKIQSLCGQLSAIFSEGDSITADSAAKSIAAGGSTDSKSAETKAGKALKKIGKVLIVDDMEMILFIVKKQFIHFGIETDTVTSGQLAIDKIKALYEENCIYDLVFMDHMMPKMDGIETTSLIRKWEAEANAQSNIIIALTANSETDLDGMYKKNGFDGYVSKPIAAQDLEGIFTKWIPHLIKRN